jgi:DNA-binding NtrC family response regulator
VIKRFVILQDEGLVIAELRRARANAETAISGRGSGFIPPPPPAAAVNPPAMSAPAPPPPAPAPSAPAAPAVVPSAPAAPVAVAENEREEEPVAESAAPAGTVSLPELAREAAMRAERAAIQQALDRFRWNRRKAADYLGVSYKTLLNKMKECGISEQA